MLNNFQLAVIVKQGADLQIQRIPMHQALQQSLAVTWQEQLEDFLDETEEIEFTAGYQPEQHERFVVTNFVPPEWLSGETSATIGDLDPISQDETLSTSIKCIAGFAQDERDNQVVLFQNFSRSHVIRPGTFLFLREGTYETLDRSGLTLDTKLAAVYYQVDGKFLFRNYRSTNMFMPLEAFYAEASAQQIREILAHEKLAPLNVEAMAADTNQWFRKRFAMLRDSGVLDQFTVNEIMARSAGYDVGIHIDDGKIVFPDDRASAKKLLQFLNEELFKGPITETLFETNSKREAD
ncbi:MAG: DUF4868 domain-containing protein [Ignavibacteria bacterium]|nr:DUF4868 domain-containing protein [Ignavibacteria bacterium]